DYERARVIEHPVVRRAALAGLAGRTEAGHDPELAQILQAVARGPRAGEVQAAGGARTADRLRLSPLPRPHRVTATSRKGGSDARRALVPASGVGRPRPPRG